MKVVKKFLELSKINMLPQKGTAILVGEQNIRCHEINKEPSVKAYPVTSVPFPLFRLFIVICIYFLKSSLQQKNSSFAYAMICSTDSATTIQGVGYFSKPWLVTWYHGHVETSLF